MYVIWLFDVSAASFLLDLQYSCGVWYVPMVLYGKGIVKERVTCRKEITLAIVETIAH